MAHTRPRCLDAFCGVGGAAVGYDRAGFDVVGVDNYRQLDYPFLFILADAIEYVREHGRHFDFIHASPPCQGYTRARGHDNHPDLMSATRAALQSTGRPYVIENVPEAPMSGITLCGIMFGLRVARHRRFESNVRLAAPAHIPHPRRTYTAGHPSYHGTDGIVAVYGNSFAIDAGRAALGITHTRSRRGLANVIPPAYTEYIGRQIPCSTSSC